MLLLKSFLIRLFIGFLLATHLTFGAQAVTWEEMTTEERDLPGAIYRRVKSLTESFENLRDSGNYGLSFKTEEEFKAGRGEYFNDMFLNAYASFIAAYRSISTREDLLLCDNPRIGDEFKAHIRTSVTRLYDQIQGIFVPFHTNLLDPDTLFSRATLETWFNQWFREPLPGGDYPPISQLEELNRVVPGRLSEHYRPYFFPDYGTSTRPEGFLVREERPALPAASPLNLLQPALPAASPLKVPGKAAQTSRDSQPSSKENQSGVALAAAAHASALPVRPAPSQTRQQFLDSDPGKFYNFGLDHKNHKIGLAANRQDRDEHIMLFANKFSIHWTRIMLGQANLTDVQSISFTREYGFDVAQEGHLPTKEVVPTLKKLQSIPLDVLFEFHHLDKPATTLSFEISDLRLNQLFENYEKGPDYRNSLKTIQRHNYLNPSIYATPNDLFLRALTYLYQINISFPNDDEVKTLVAQTYGLILDQEDKCARGLFGRSFLLTQSIAELLINKLSPPHFQR